MSRFLLMSRAVKELEKMGHVSRDEDGSVTLTPSGERIAAEIYERHRFFTQRLIAAGVDPETAAKEACHMEHGVSENSFEKLKQSMERQDKGPLKVMLLFFEDGEEDIVLKVQNLIRSVTRIDYMEMPQFETQSTSSALRFVKTNAGYSAMAKRFCSRKRSTRFSLYLYKTQTMY